jgi:hypothetical protein
VKKFLLSLVIFLSNLVFIGVIVWSVVYVVPNNIKRNITERRIEKRVKKINKESQKILKDAIHDIYIINFPMIVKGRMIDSMDAFYLDIDTVIFPMIDTEENSSCIDITKVELTYIKIAADSAELGLEYAKLLKAYAEELKNSLIKQDSLMND